MAVKRRKVDTLIERQIIIGMIVSTQYLREMIQLYTADLLEIQYGPIIAKWCIDFYQQYEKAPNEDIKELFEDWLKTKPDDELVTYIEEFLDTLSDEFEHAEKFNVEYLMDKTVKYFKLRSAKNLRDELDFCLEQNDIEAAEDAIADYHKVEREVTEGIDPFDDEESIQSAFENKSEPLFKLPGALGRLLNDQFTRDSFVVFMAPEKRGKTWWIQMLSMFAHKARCNVAFFSCGDMSKDQQVRRIHISLSRKSDMAKYCGELLIPILDCEKNQKDICTKKCRKSHGYAIVDSEGVFEFEDAPDHVVCTVCQKDDPREFQGAVWHKKRPAVKPLTWREALAAGKEYKKRIRAKGFKLATFPSDTLSVSGMKRQLDIWERTEGFVPDVILSDYMDIKAPEENSGSDSRSIENKKWKAGRRLSQELHCCFISLTQSDAASALVPLITREHFSEDKRKFAHVTAMYALNQYGDEKQRGILRVGPIVVREDEFNDQRCVHVLQCLQIGAAYIASY